FTGKPFAIILTRLVGHMPEESFEEQSSLRGVHVFLVVDDPESRELMKTVLEYAAARVALGALEGIRPDVLLVDLSTEGENALWLIERVRALPRGADIPAIAVT